MASGLKQFRIDTNGFARNHHFSLGIIDWRDLSTSNKILGYIKGAASTEFFSIFCSSMSLPSKTINTIEVPVQYGVPPIKIGGNVKYGNWTVKFYGDELMILRTQFLNWMELINNTGNHAYSLPGKYKSTLAFAALLTTQDIPVHVYSFKGLFPVSVGDLVLQQQDTNITTFTVTFEFDFFRINEPIAFGLAIANELVNELLSVKHKKRTINAPYGISVKIPF